jgi:ligand-binding sensor domain-containing protein
MVRVRRVLWGVAVVAVVAAVGCWVWEERRREVAGRREERLAVWRELPTFDLGYLKINDSSWIRYEQKIAREADGTLWFATLNGLARYNPSNDRWRLFTEIDGLPSNIVFAVYISQNGTLWLGTGKGLASYDPSTETWTQALISWEDSIGLDGSYIEYLYESTNLDFNPSDSRSITAINEDRKGRLWLHDSWAKDVTVFDPISKKTLVFDSFELRTGIHNYFFEDKDNKVLLISGSNIVKFETNPPGGFSIHDSSLDRINYAYQDDGSEIWLTDSKSIVRYDLSQNSIINKWDLKDITKSQPHLHDVVIIQEFNKKIHVLHKPNIYYYIADKNIWKSLNIEGCSQGDLIPKSVHQTNFIPGQQDRIWAIQHNSIYSINLISGQCEQLVFPELGDNSSSFRNSWLIEHKAGSVVSYHGLYQLDIDNQKWESLNTPTHHHIVGNGPLSYLNRETYLYLQESSQELYVSPEISVSFIPLVDCPHRFNTQSKMWMNLIEYTVQHLPDGQFDESHATCYDLPGYKAEENYFVLKDIDSNYDLEPYNSAYKGITIFHQNLEPWSISFEKDGNRILDFQQDSQQGIWISSINDLRLYDQNNWGSDSYDRINLFDLGLSAEVIDIHESTNKNLWLASSSQAIQIDPETHQIQAQLSAPSDKKITAIFQDSNDSIWLATTQGIHLYSAQGKSLFQPQGLLINSIIDEVREDETGKIWFLGTTEDNTSSTIIRINTTLLFNPNYKIKDQAIWQLSASDLQGVSALTFPDSQGAIWLATDQGIARQTWNPHGIPGRRELIPFIDHEKWLSAVSPLHNPSPINNQNQKDFVVWRTRLTGLLKSAATEADSAAYPGPDTASPVTVLEAAPQGKVWVGRIFEGITLRDLDGTPHRLPDDDPSQALPQESVLDISQHPISQRPNSQTAQAWIATHSGAARVRQTDTGLERISDPEATAKLGPIDAIIALPDGGAYIALNPIDPVLFQDPTKANQRARTQLIRLDPAGQIITEIPTEIQGNILDMTLDPQGKTVWVGTTNGLYALENDQLKPLQGGALPQLPIRTLTTDPTGTIWMGIDGQDNSSESGDNLSPAQIIGYAPQDQRVTFYTEAEGLPRGLRIASLNITPQGDLAAMVAGQLVKGYAYVPRQFPTAIVVLLTLATSLGTSLSLSQYRQHQATKTRYRPLLQDSEKFFRSLPLVQTIRRHNYRTLYLKTEDQAKSGESGPLMVRVALGDLLPVEAVQETWQDLPPAPKSAKSDPPPKAFLVYPRELDPAAARQLDMYRLRGQATIIPISHTFLRSKLGEGPDKIREAFDGLQRRYLGRRDLFKARNAIDEPRFFFGRRSLIDDLFQALSRGEHGAIVGMRKSGKSSLLNMLRLRLDAFPVVCIDLQFYRRDQPDWPDQFLGEILQRYDEWGKARYDKHWQVPEIGSGSIDGTTFRQALHHRRRLCQAQGNHQPLIILLDELERVFPQVSSQSEFQSGLAQGQLRDQAERFIKATGILRALGQEGGDKLISLVIADLKPSFNRVNAFAVAGIDTNPFYRFFQEYFLPPLDALECHTMLTEIGHVMGLTLAPEAITWLYENSGGYPALTRQLASAAYDHKPEAETQLDLEHCYEGYGWLDRQSGDIDTFFAENLWHQASPAEKSILALAATETGTPEANLSQPGPVPHLEDQQPQQHPSQHPPTCNRKNLLEAQRLLIATGALEPCPEGYRVRGTLLRHWLRDNVIL